MMRKTISFLILILMLCALAACGSGSGESGSAVWKGDSKAPRIVTTIFPEYDWVTQILGDNPAGAEVFYLLDSGVDMHSYQPTTEDMLRISECDLFIYVGGESDGWIRNTLSATANKDMVTISLLDVLDSKGRTLTDSDHPVIDEHVWLSPRNAACLCEAIEEAIAGLDPVNARVYDDNLQAYLETLDALDRAYDRMVAAAPVKALLFGDRFPFRYLTEDYGLSYCAAFDGCSAESEASFETIRSLAATVDREGLSCVMTIDGSDQKIAEAVIRSTKAQNQRILSLNSMQSVTADDAKAGASYVNIMEQNLSVLKEALR